MSRPIPPCPFLTPAGFASPDWQRWFDSVGQEVRSLHTTALRSGADATVAKFGANGKAPQAAVILPAAAVDLPTALTLVNAIRAALIANGIGA